MEYGYKMKITKKKSIKIISKFLEKKIVLENWYQDIKPYLKAVILYGSVAKGTNRPDSDIDILFIIPLDTEEKYTKGEYSYKYEDQEINIVIRSIERIRDIANRDPNSFQKEVFRDSEIIWQKDTEVQELLQKLDKDKI